VTPAVVACCSKAGLAIIRALGEHGVPVIGLCYGSGQIGAFSRFVTKQYRCPDPSEDESAFIAALLRLDESLQSAVLFPSDDGSLVAISRNAESLSRKYRLVSERWPLVRTLIEKHFTYEIARQHGVPCPRLEMVRSTAESLAFASSIGFPCLLKPPFGHLFFKRYRKKMLMVNSEAELCMHMSTVAEYGGEVMLSEFIPGGDECGTNYNSFALDGTPYCEFTAEKVRNKPRLIGFPTVVRSIVLPEVRALGRKMLAALKYSDFSCMEFKRDVRDGVYKLMEVNGRHNYSGALAVACGMNFPVLSYRRALGEMLPLMPTSQREELCWIDEERDAFGVARSIMDRHSSDARAHLAAYRGSRVFAVYRANDPLPSLHLVHSSLASALRRRRPFARPEPHVSAAG
jgi:D-aspartate ligase